MAGLNNLSGVGQSEAVSSTWGIPLIKGDSAVPRTTEILFRLVRHCRDIVADPDAAWSLLARQLARQRYDAILLDMNFTASQSSGEKARI